jgi:hypothetical protein
LNLVYKQLEGSDLFVTQNINTLANYETKLRIMKKYKFAFKSMDDKRVLIPDILSLFRHIQASYSKAMITISYLQVLWFRRITIENYEKKFGKT